MLARSASRTGTPPCGQTISILARMADGVGREADDAGGVEAGVRVGDRVAVAVGVAADGDGFGVESVIDEGQAAGAGVRHDDTAATRRPASERLLGLANGWRIDRTWQPANSTPTSSAASTTTVGEGRHRQLGPGASFVSIGVSLPREARPCIGAGIAVTSKCRTRVSSE